MLYPDFGFVVRVVYPANIDPAIAMNHGNGIGRSEGR